jgi:SAM-dependent methyltransferase
MSDVWSERAQGYRESETHRQGADLDLVIEWAEPGFGVTALDVATGGGHVARRLREAGCTVVSSDPAPGMQPDVICRAESLPFAEASFDVVTCRIAPHHFDDIRLAGAEMARVARHRVVVEDNLFASEQDEEAERLHDPSHVRCYSEVEWRDFFESAALRIDRVEILEKRVPVAAWLDRVGCVGADAERVREILAYRIDDEDRLGYRVILLRGVKP